MVNNHKARHAGTTPPSHLAWTSGDDLMEVPLVALPMLMSGRRVDDVQLLCPELSRRVTDEAERESP